MKKMIRQNQSNMLFFLIFISICVIFFLFVSSQTARVQTPPSVTLNILNPMDPATGKIIVEKGDPVEVAFVVSSEIVSSPKDKIQLRRVDNDIKVSEKKRGKQLRGIVSLDTSDDNALGELKVVYRLEETGAILATADKSILVVEKPPQVVEYPGEDIPSIQAAVDKVADGGTVFIGPGNHSVEPIIISGKTVIFQGAGSSRDPKRKTKAITRLFAPRPTEVVDVDQHGIMNFIEEAAGAIVDLDLEGGNAGVFVRNAGGSIRIEDVCISDTVRGISYKAASDQAASEFTLVDSSIKNCLWNGCSFSSSQSSPSPLLINILDTIVIEVRNIGILLIDQVAEVKDEYIAHCKGAGLVGVRSHITVHDSFFMENSFASIALFEGSYAKIENNRISYTNPMEGTGGFGDGITAWLWCHVDIIDNLIEYGRAGVSNFASHMYLKDNRIKCFSFDLEGEALGPDFFYPGYPPVQVGFSFDDDGGNLCCNLSQSCNPWCTLDSCHAHSVGLEPPKPIVPSE